MCLLFAFYPSVICLDFSISVLQSQVSFDAAVKASNRPIWALKSPATSLLLQSILVCSFNIYISYNIHTERKDFDVKENFAQLCFPYF